MNRKQNWPLHDENSSEEKDQNAKADESLNFDVNLALGSLFSDVDVDILDNLSQVLSTTFISTCTDQLVSQESWSQLGTSPAIKFLSRFAPPNEWIDTWRYFFDEDMNIRTNAIIKGKYKIGKIINQGAIAECRLGFPVGDDAYGPVALKIAKFIPGTENAQKICLLFTKELTIWKSLHHPHILPLEDFLIIPGMLVAVCPLIENGNLLKVLKQSKNNTLPIPLIRKIMRQVASALFYLHYEKNFIHRDVKLENILIDSFDQVYLCDFGLSQPISTETKIMSSKDAFSELPLDLFPCKLGSPTSSSGLIFGCTCSCSRCSLPSSSGATVEQIRAQPPSFCTGSIWYCPPEELLPEVKYQVASCMCDQIANGPKIDVWAFGITLYAMAKGKYPFMDEFFPRLQAKVQAGEYEPIPFSLDEENQDILTLNELISNCLQVDRNKRWDMEQVLSSQFFSNSEEDM